MWPFKKKQPKPEPKSILWAVPENQSLEFCRLYDKMMKNGAGKYELVEFWNFAKHIAPEKYKGEQEYKCSVEWENQYPYLKITEKL